MPFPTETMHPTLEQDLHLASEINDGNREALDRLISLYLGPTYRYVLRRLGPGSEETALAVTGAAFEEALRRMKRYPRGDRTVPMRLWLLRPANRALARRKGHTESAAGGDEAAVLRTALAGLSGKKADAAAMALFEELPPEELALALGVSRRRAMILLRQALRQIGRAHPPSPDWSLGG